jgi:FKBP12-rapamycin complex-associated protein
MKILCDSSLSVHHTAVITAIMYIFKTLGLKCVPFMPQIMPPFLSMMRTCPSGMLEFYFQQLAVIVSIVKQHIRKYLPEIISLIQDFWNTNPNLQATSLSLIESIAQALDGEFKIYLPTLLPHIVQIFDTDSSDKRYATLKLLNALVTFGPALEEYLHIIIPPLVRLFEKVDAPMSIRKQAIVMTGQLCRQVPFYDQASRVIHPLIRTLTFADLRSECMDTLSRIVFQMGPEFTLFIPTLNKVIDFSSNEYES